VAPGRLTQPGKPHAARGLETHVLSQQIETWLPFKTDIRTIDSNYIESTPKLFTKTHHNTMTTKNNNNNNNELG